jgi:hypothetical protein
VSKRDSLDGSEDVGEGDLAGEGSRSLGRFHAIYRNIGPGGIHLL